MNDVTTATKILPGTELYGEAADWLHTEAELLDTGREREWLEGMIGAEIVYHLPLRQTVERARGAGFSDDTFHLDETYGSLASAGRAQRDRVRVGRGPAVAHAPLRHEHPRARRRRATRSRS